MTKCANRFWFAHFSFFGGCYGNEKQAGLYAHDKAHHQHVPAADVLAADPVSLQHCGHHLCGKAGPGRPAVQEHRREGRGADRERGGHRRAALSSRDGGIYAAGLFLHRSICSAVYRRPGHRRRLRRIPLCLYAVLSRHLYRDHVPALSAIRWQRFRQYAHAVGRRGDQPDSGPHPDLRSAGLSRPGRQRGISQ